ncbi:hypothetical protein [Geminicoccus roseus]|uniref:hypothetical protein n=1 Tax=Geminicoccus roseus TaxID=404900 RepID=UPI0004018847|nr:hypothetical protein [Geminicoccus roseus]
MNCPRAERSFRSGQHGRKRQDILATTGRLFCRDGFGRTGIDRPMARAGGALGTFYRKSRRQDEVVAGAAA